MQLNAFCDTLFARYADLSGPVYLWYAIRFYQLVLAIFGIATVHTLVPALSRAIKQGDKTEGQMLFAFGFRKLAIAMFVATAALVVLNIPMIDLFFGWGHFSRSAVVKTAQCLAAYAFGLFPATAIMLDAAVFYAQGNFRLPTWLAIGGVMVNGLLNTILIVGLGFGAVSVALATSFERMVSILFVTLFFVKAWVAVRFEGKRLGPFYRSSSDCRVFSNTRSIFFHFGIETIGLFGPGWYFWAGPCRVCVLRASSRFARTIENLFRVGLALEGLLKTQVVGKISR